ncbi:Flavin prenyltransferase UbiX [Baekduia alba]|nr:UbiX family flavin prenyltransferase [Baekduia alba]WCB93341.1 Flavin prenyltransferase UbiX [Baekduia alba]
MDTPERFIVGISGSTGAVYGVRLLEILSERFPEIETHAIVSHGARATIEYELGRSAEDVLAMASVVHDDNNLGAAIASGTFITRGMVVAPCSIKTLGALATCRNDNLITRAGDVCLKERRRLVLVVRETPLHLGHLRLMTTVTESGAVVLPPSPAFYHRPHTIADLVDHTVVKILDVFGLHVSDLIDRWEGLDHD